jgi:hypothetical protein
MHPNGDAAGPPPDGLRAIEAEFYTEHFVVRGNVTSPEPRLSDHLNSSTTTLKLRPTRVQRSVSGLRVNVTASDAYLAKAHLLLAVPLVESGGAGPANGPQTPPRAAWIQTVTQLCWGGIDRYSLVGSVHMDAARDPRLFLRSLEERRFLPFTNARLTFPDGSVREFVTVLVNRLRLEVLAIHPEDRAGMAASTAARAAPHVEQAAL